jgi:hypothetical protein
MPARRARRLHRMPQHRSRTQERRRDTRHRVAEHVRLRLDERAQRVPHVREARLHVREVRRLHVRAPRQGRDREPQVGRDREPQRVHVLERQVERDREQRRVRGLGRPEAIAPVAQTQPIAEEQAEPRRVGALR